MSRRLIVRPDAESDIVEVALWYESREAGLGFDVTSEIRSAIKRAVEYPRALCCYADILKFIASLPDAFPTASFTSSA